MKISGNLNNLKAYFTFSKGERNGIISLIVLLALVLAGNKLLSDSNSKTEPENLSELKKQVDSLFVKSDTLHEASHKLLVHPSESKPEIIEERKRILLNSCDSAMLTQLPGIGPVLASRIIKYRNLLGGYYSINQLKEVYGLKDENFEKAKSQIILDMNNISKFSLDTAGFKTMVRHPYIGKDMAWKIINFRKELKQEYICKENFASHKIGDSAQWTKLEPYIILQKNAVSK